MPFEAAPEDIDFDLLAASLKALSHPARLELLWRLRAPANPATLAVQPRRRDHLPPERAMSRQTILAHLAKLEEAGVMRRLDDPAGGASRWGANVPQVFALVEELRKLTAIPATLDVEETVAAAGPRAQEWARGPKLVLLTGPWEGRLFRLEGPGPWTLGRSRARSVALTYDPFVSAEHAEVRREEPGFALRVQAAARNPSRVNLAPVAPGGVRRLAHGDIVTLGRSTLVFHEA